MDGSALKVSSLVIGGLAVIANFIVIAKHCKTSVALTNKSLIILISFGDFLVGIYLLTIAIHDVIIFRKSYCQEQIGWITSFKCSTIGVLSTIGSQVSLFAMAGLSTVRLHGIRGSLRVPGEINMVKSLRVALGLLLIVLTSVSIAVVPMIGALEDLYVNGVKFDNGLNLFIGTPPKQRIFSALKAYYGRIQDRILSWETLLKMARKMFSHDFEHIDYTDTIRKVDFYGNDGVCLFKYFVKKGDPKKNLFGQY